MPTDKWVTLDGTVLEIKWMNSVHLANSFNLLMRQMLTRSRMLTPLGHQSGTRDTCMYMVKRTGIYDEIKRRGLLNWSGSDSYQIILPWKRETIEQLIYFNAVLDIPNAKVYRRLFKEDIDSVIQLLISNAQNNDPIAQEVVRLAAQYRLQRS